MRIGKITENILNRSVIKNITYRSENLLQGPSAGKDCGKLRIAGGEQMVFSCNPVSGPADSLGRRAFFRMANDLVCSGALPSGMLLTLLMPVNSEEKEIKDIMGQIGALAGEYSVDLIGGHTEICPEVSTPVLSVTGVGCIQQDFPEKYSGLKPGMDIVMTKWAGAPGAARLVKERRKELLTRFTTDFLEQAESYFQGISCIPEAVIAWKAGVTALHNVSIDGVFGALWELGQAYGIGLEVDLKKIPIRQESVEICEFFDVNPYMISSEGSLLAGTADGERLVREYKKAEIPAAVIGHVCDDNGRIIINGDERRFLTPPGNQ